MSPPAPSDVTQLCAHLAAKTGGGMGVNADVLSQALTELIEIDRSIQTEGPTPEVLESARPCIHRLKSGLATPTLFIELLQQVRKANANTTPRDAITSPAA